MQNRSIHILLIRHGQTDANASGRLQGHQPTPLNLEGVRQAHLLANRVATYLPAVRLIVSSDLPRAMQTAAPIASACGLSMKTDAAWRERSFGLLEGKPVGDRKLWEAVSGESDPPGAEPSAEMQSRVYKALLGVAKAGEQYQVIAVVTHGGPIRSILKMLADGRLPTIRNHAAVEIPAIPNCSILHLVGRKHQEGLRWKIEAMNDISHLPDRE